MHTFSEVRRRCDHLIVGLNTDASIHRLKGPEDSSKTLRADVLALPPTIDTHLFLTDEPSSAH